MRRWKKKSICIIEPLLPVFSFSSFFLHPSCLDDEETKVAGGGEEKKRKRAVARSSVRPSVRFSSSLNVCLYGASTIPPRNGRGGRKKGFIVVRLHAA